MKSGSGRWVSKKQIFEVSRVRLLLGSLLLLSLYGERHKTWFWWQCLNLNDHYDFSLRVKPLGCKVRGEQSMLISHATN